MGSEKNRYLECGRIINVHGTAGAVKAESWCDSPEVLASLSVLYIAEGGTFRPVSVAKASVQKRFELFRLEGVDDADKAEAMRGTVLYADRADVPLPEGSFFIADLIGLPVVDADTGTAYGTVSEVFNAGASDIYTVATPDGDRMIPAVPEFVIRIEPGSAVYVRPIEGMFG